MVDRFHGCFGCAVHNSICNAVRIRGNWLHNLFSFGLCRSVLAILFEFAVYYGQWDFTFLTSTFNRQDLGSLRLNKAIKSISSFIFWSALGLIPKNDKCLSCEYKAVPLSTKLIKELFSWLFRKRIDKIYMGFPVFFNSNRNVSHPGTGKKTVNEPVFYYPDSMVLWLAKKGWPGVEFYILASKKGLKKPVTVFHRDRFVQFIAD